jgi:hypothetical protein
MNTSKQKLIVEINNNVARKNSQRIVNDVLKGMDAPMKSRMAMSMAMLFVLALSIFDGLIKPDLAKSVFDIMGLLIPSCLIMIFLMGSKELKKNVKIVLGYIVPMYLVFCYVHLGYTEIVGIASLFLVMFFTAVIYIFFNLVINDYFDEHA